MGGSPFRHLWSSSKHENWTMVPNSKCRNMSGTDSRTDIDVSDLVESRTSKRKQRKHTTKQPVGSAMLKSRSVHTVGSSQSSFVVLLIGI